MINITPEQLYDFSKEVLKEYNIDLTDEPISTDEYLKLTCYSVLDQFQQLNDKELEVALISSVTALTLENFLLNYKMLKMVKQNDNSKRKL
jgi:hypothetical protein